MMGRKIIPTNFDATVPPAVRKFNGKDYILQWAPGIMNHELAMQRAKNLKDMKDSGGRQAFYVRVVKEEHWSMDGRKKLVQWLIYARSKARDRKVR